MTNAPRPATRDPRPATRDPRPIAQVDRIISWKFSCAACGQNCTTTVPVVNQEVNFAMPDCPVAADAISEVIDQVLPTGA
mmetsp:Transcript_27590/g.75090  ORF Transcript_27590/g.75090 Transcript_27590/m.75090 type:complete len:80 (+) Transcript_27590:652-891(+)